MKKIMMIVLCGLMVGSVFAANGACLTCIGKSALHQALHHKNLQKK